MMRLEVLAKERGDDRLEAEPSIATDLNFGFGFGFALNGGAGGVLLIVARKVVVVASHILGRTEHGEGYCLRSESEQNTIDVEQAAGCTLLRPNTRGVHGPKAGSERDRHISCLRTMG